MTVRLAALGDSITFGIGDPAPDGRWRGFAALLAEGLGEPDHAEMLNLGVSGALSADVASEQLPRALAWRPHVATVVVGVNDTLRSSFDVLSISEHVQQILSELSAAGTVVLTACLPSPGQMLRLPQALARPLGRRIAAVNAVLHTASRRFGAVHVHLADDPYVLDRRMWSVDRLHPSERGHRRIASLFYDALGPTGLCHGERPGLDPTNPPPTRFQQAKWMATKGTRWVVDRSTDLLPDLIALAASEWLIARRDRRRSTECQIEVATQAALAKLQSDAIA